MSNLNQINTFFKKKNIAVIGISRNKHKFGNLVLKELTKLNFNTIPVGNNISEIDNMKVYRSIDEVHEEIYSAIISVKQEFIFDIVKQLHAAGVKNIWLQKGADSREAVKFAEENKINIIYNECILMYAPPVKSIHKFHKWIWKVTGKHAA